MEYFIKFNFRCSQGHNNDKFDDECLQNFITCEQCNEQILNTIANQLLSELSQREFNSKIITTLIASQYLNKSRSTICHYLNNSNFPLKGKKIKGKWEIDPLSTLQLKKRFNERERGISPKEAAEILNVSIKKIYQRLNLPSNDHEKIFGDKLGNRWSINRKLLSNKI